MKYLPIMETDIVIEEKVKQIQIIIDTKFYSRTLSKSQYGTSGTIYSSNLYQIYSYISNSDFSGEIRGILLYPRVTEDINADYKIGDRRVSIKTINLDDDWDKIEERLLAII